MSTAGELWRAFGPVTVSIAVVGLLALILRWAYGGGRTSLVERRPMTGGSDEYGLLVPVSSPGSLIEAEVQRRTLEDAGVRATVVNTAEGPRIMVFSEHVRIARGILAAGS